MEAIMIMVIYHQLTISAIFISDVANAPGKNN
jgi:hypothetical protein